MKRLFAFIVFSLMSVMMMVAQRITGHVSDAKSGEAAPFVNVFYEGTREGVQTDIDGNFSISYRAGRKLTVSCVGYETYSSTSSFSLSTSVSERQRWWGKRPNIAGRTILRWN